MNDPIAIMLKFGFLALLYLFLLWVARSALKDVSGGQATALIDDTGPTARPRQMDLRSGVFPQLEAVAALAVTQASAWTWATASRSAAHPRQTCRSTTRSPRPRTPGSSFAASSCT